MFIRHARTRLDNRTDTRTAAAMSVYGDVTLTGKPAIIIHCVIMIMSGFSDEIETPRRKNMPERP